MPTDNTDRVKLEILAGAVLDLFSAQQANDGSEWDAMSTVEEVLKEFGLEHADDGAWYRAWADWQKQLPAAPEPNDPTAGKGGATPESEET